MTETTQGNGAGKSRRAKTSTERSREFRRRQREKAEEAARQAALQEAEHKKVEQAEARGLVAAWAGDRRRCCRTRCINRNDVAEVVAAVPARKVEWLAWRILAPAGRSAKPDILTVLVALALAAVSAGFSISDMTAIFTGSYWPVIVMGGVLECAKLRAVALTGMGRGSRRVRFGLVVLVAVLMGLNAVGDYGFLVRAHVGHQVEGNVAVAARLAYIDGRTAVQTTVVANIDRQLGQIDGSIEKAMAAGKVNGAMALAGDQRHTRTQLQVERMAAGKNLAELKVERARIEGERRIVEADLGPVRYLAALIGAEDETVMRWFILTVALLLDPAAVLLLLAAATRRPHD